MTMPDTSAFDRVLAALAATTGFAPRGNNGSRMARCPAHDDRTPSLSVTKKPDRVLVSCQAGCDTDAVLAALSLTRQDLFDQPKEAEGRPRKVAEYPYTDEEGRVLYVIERLEPGRDGARKTFLTRYPNGKGDRRVVYRLTDVMAAACDDRPIYFCFADDTEVLTPTGWTLISKLPAGSMVAQYDNGRVEFAEPTDRQQFQYEGDMVDVTADWCAVSVTPDHRMLTRWRTSTPVVVTAAGLGAQRLLPVAGRRQGAGSTPTSAQARVLAAWQADGVNCPRGHRVAWNLRKERKKERLRQLFREAGVSWREQSFESTKDWTYFTVDRRDLGWLDGFLPEKRFHWGMLDWSLTARDALLDELGFWDGDRPGREGIRYFTADEQCAEVVSALAATSGYGSIVRIDDRPDRLNQARQWVVNLVPRDWRTLGNPPGRSAYDGTVYCLTVPSGFLVTRRQGKVTIAGNCEGEKDADRLRGLGHTATTSVHGAGKWRHEYAEPFDGATVIVVADRDEPGLAHARTVAASLRHVGCTVRIVQSAVDRKGADVSDHLDAGYGVDDLVPVLDDTAADLRGEVGGEVDTEVPDTIAELDGDQAATEPASWAPVDLTDILAGTYVPEAPNLMARTDGFCLLYLGRCHSFHGESESGKSLVVQAQAADILASGGAVLYIDYESDAPAVVGRLRELGAPVEALRTRFHYVHPEVSPFSRDAETEAWMRLLGTSYTLAVIDGVTDALGTNGVKTNDNDEISAWSRRIARPIARRTGAAVVLIDHVTKDADSRGRFALGGQAKMNTLDGSAYTVEVKEALGRGMRGVISLRVAKDRPGGVRGHCGPFRSLDRTQEAARVVVDSTDPGRIRVTIEPPSQVMAEPGKAPVQFRPTFLMERVSRFLETVGGEISQNKLREGVTGKKSVVDQAASILVAEGYAGEKSGPRGARLFFHISRYSEAADSGGPEGSDLALTSTSPPPRPHLVPGEVSSTSPLAPPPEGGEVEVDVAGTRSTTGHLAPAWPNPEDQCAECGFHPNSAGHFQNCDGY